MRNMLLLLLAILLVVPLAAYAQDVVELDAFGLRYYPAEDEYCITRDSFPKEALAMLGADEATVKAAMENDDLYLIVLTSQGKQVSFRIAEKPTAITVQNSFGLDADLKEQLLTLLARADNQLSASWVDSMPGFALLTKQQSQQETLPVFHTLTLCALYLNQVYAFQTDVVGRSLTEEDNHLLLSIAKRAVLLGASSQPTLEGDAVQGPLTLPVLPPLTEEQAAFTYKTGAIPLEIGPLPAVVGSTSLPIQGTTGPGVSLKYAINGVTSSRIKADDAGAFSVTMMNLDPEKPNEVTITAYSGEEISTASCILTVNWQHTPMTLSQTSGSTTEDIFPLEGITLPGSKVQLIRRTSTTPVQVQEDGNFSLQVALKKEGDNTFTIRSLATGYKRSDLEVTITRVGNAESGNNKAAKPIDYAKLAKKPSQYEGKSVQYQGQVTALASINGQPMFLLTVAEGQSLVCVCKDLLAIQLGQELTLAGTLSGILQSFESPWASGTYPSLSLTAMIP